CHLRGDHNLPKLDAQAKIYLADPLLARIAHLRTGHLLDPDTAQISEQQIGQALLQAVDLRHPERFVEYTSVMHARSATRKEVDFTGPPLGAVAFEGKYSDKNFRQESATIRAMFNGRGVMATRAWIGEIDDVRCIPASFIAYLLG